MNIQELDEKIRAGRVVDGLEINSYKKLDHEIVLLTSCGIEIWIIGDGENLYFGE